MSLVIMITARKFSTFVWAGPGITLTNAVHVRSWRPSRQVFPKPLRSLTRGDDQPDIWVSWSSAEDKAPFGAGLGECLYDSGSLFFFAGTRLAGNVMMVLWGFPM